MRGEVEGAPGALAVAVQEEVVPPGDDMVQRDGVVSHLCVGPVGQPLGQSASHQPYRQPVDRAAAVRRDRSGRSAEIEAQSQVQV
jgi:hypothetical protein